MSTGNLNNSLKTLIRLTLKTNKKKMKIFFIRFLVYHLQHHVAKFHIMLHLLLHQLVLTIQHQLVRLQQPLKHLSLINLLPLDSNEFWKLTNLTQNKRHDQKKNKQTKWTKTRKKRMKKTLTHIYTARIKQTKN